MKITKLMLRVALAFAAGISLVSCDVVPDMSLDFGGYEIFPDGNPIWYDDGSWAPPPIHILQAAASNGATAVAVGTTIVALNSGDSLWTTTLNLSGCGDIIWADSVFVAVGPWTGVSYSRDGATWNSNMSATSYWLNSVAYSGSRVVATGNMYDSYSTMRAAIFIINLNGSLDKIGPFDSITYLTKIVWADSRFIAIGELRSTEVTSSVMISSTDGVTWTRCATWPHPVFTDIIWCDDHFLAATENLILKSRDGIEWTEVAALTGFVSRLYKHESTYLAVGPQGHVSISSDGLTWNQATFPAGYDLKEALYFDGRYFVFGVEGIFSSTDGMQWIKCKLL